MKSLKLNWILNKDSCSRKYSQNGQSFPSCYKMAYLVFLDSINKIVHKQSYKNECFESYLFWSIVEFHRYNAIVARWKILFHKLLQGTVQSLLWKKIHVYKLQGERNLLKILRSIRYFPYSISNYYFLVVEPCRCLSVHVCFTNVSV